MALLTLSCNDKNKDKTELSASLELKNSEFDGKDHFIGSYAYELNGEPQVKISKLDGDYYLSIKDSKGIWSDSEILNDEFDDELCSYFDGADCNLFKQDFLLNISCCGIFKVPKNTKVSYKTLETGYVLLAIGIPDLYKIN